MNNTISEMLNRKSVRVFESKDISTDDKKLILTAAINAPTAGNQQLYTIINVTDENLKNKLAITCDNQPFIAKAKMVLIFCADAQKWYQAYMLAGCAARKPAIGDIALAICDAMAAAQNAVNAAESLGIGSCYIGDIMENCETHRDILQLPQYVFPVTMLVLGYPTQGQIEREKPRRFNLDDVVCQNAYSLKPDDELLKSFECKANAKPVKEWLSAFCKRKYNSEFSREMSRSVEEYFKSFI